MYWEHLVLTDQERESIARLVEYERNNIPPLYLIPNPYKRKRTLWTVLQDIPFFAWCIFDKIRGIYGGYKFDRLIKKHEARIKRR